MSTDPSTISYSTAAISIPYRTKLQEDQIPVRNDQCRSQFLLHSAPTPRVCLFFHGFTAAPYQFLPMGQAFYQAGYNVMIPRLPGHGEAGDWNGKNPPPLPTDTDTYKTFALEWLQQAQSLGGKVIVGGAVWRCNFSGMVGTGKSGAGRSRFTVRGLSSAAAIW